MRDIRISCKQMTRQCSYILQEDNLYADFSVQETMWLAACLKIGYIGPEKKQQMVSGVVARIFQNTFRNPDGFFLQIDMILDSLHLRHTKRTYCGTLSGGQRKRLSIALELLDNRPILFLDEPTTGLDSLSAAHCVRLLHNLAHEGRTIVCTIHQPAGSVFETFDQVYVLAGGHSIYQGSASNTVAFLSSNGLHCPQYHSSADYRRTSLVLSSYMYLKLKICYSFGSGKRGIWQFHEAIGRGSCKPKMAEATSYTRCNSYFQSGYDPTDSQHHRSVSRASFRVDQVLGSGSTVSHSLPSRLGIY